MNWPVHFQKCHKVSLVAPAHPTEKKSGEKRLNRHEKEKQCITHDWLLDQKHMQNGYYWENLYLVCMLDNKLSESDNCVKLCRRMFLCLQDT